jgi:16S rRNA (guanine966-N2)-methyltransferase
MTTYSKKNASRNKVRIIAGKWRSRLLLFTGDVETLRPTPDRVRETVFNWLQNKIAGARCLDLFAGSGALAFEACSRQAASVTAIDNSQEVVAMMKDNCQLLDCQNMDVVHADSIAWLKKNTDIEPFDIVFLDPPYSLDLLADCCRLIESASLVKPGSIIYLESNSLLENLQLPATWKWLKAKKAGQVYFGVCERIFL